VDSAAAPAATGNKQAQPASQDPRGEKPMTEAEIKAQRYVEILQKGANGVPGILSCKDSNGDILKPYPHQRDAVRKIAGKGVDWFVLAHDAGTGKTATIFQTMAAMELIVGGGVTAIVTAPPSTLPQWEETAHDWLNIPNKKEAIVVTNKAKLITEELLSKVRVLVISRYVLARIYKMCFHHVPRYEKNANGNWVGKWVRIQGAPLHPLFRKKWDMAAYDEGELLPATPLAPEHQPTGHELCSRVFVCYVFAAHIMRNPETEWCASHHQLSKGTFENGEMHGGCKKRIAATATPVMHRPLDMVGLARCINASEQFQDKRYWSSDPHCKTINLTTVREFHKNTDRVKDTILNLPAIHTLYHDFDPGLSSDDALNYNDLLAKARSLRVRMNQSKVNGKDMQQLMLHLQRMQQMLVSPRLGEKGAEHFNSDPSEIENAGKVDTGALSALRTRIIHLQSKGHDRIMIACNHVMLMKIARAYLLEEDRKAAQENKIGTVLFYDGSLSLPRRQEERFRFLNQRKAVLFLSIGAGGTGLHLVPQKAGTPIGGYCRACIFWGSRPFSPQQVWQTFKRIHRLGQKHEVEGHHIIATGSVDYAINCVHKDKEQLANAIVDGDMDDIELDGGEWKKTGRVVDECFLMGDEGKFLAHGPPKAAPVGQRSALQVTGGGVVRLSAPATGQPAASSHAAPRAAPVSSAFFRGGGGAKRPADAAGLAGQTGPKRPRALPLPQVGGMPFGPATMRPGTGPVSLAAQAGMLDPSPTAPGVTEMGVARLVSSQAFQVRRGTMPMQGVIGHWGQ
jgi:hypothetical protein